MRKKQTLNLLAIEILESVDISAPTEKQINAMEKALQSSAASLGIDLSRPLDPSAIALMFWAGRRTLRILNVKKKFFAPTICAGDTRSKRFENSPPLFFTNTTVKGTFMNQETLSPFCVNTQLSLEHLMQALEQHLNQSETVARLTIDDAFMGLNHEDVMSSLTLLFQMIHNTKKLYETLREQLSPRAP